MAPSSKAQKRQRKIVPTIPGPKGDEDNTAAKEAVALANSTLQEEACRHDHKRSQRAKTTIHFCALSIMVVWVVIYASFVLTWAFHFLTPETRHFLSAAQIGNLQSFVLSGTIATALAKYFGADAT